MWDGNNDERYPFRNYREVWNWGDDYNLILTRGFECVPNGPDTLWYPDLGFTSAGGYDDAAEANLARRKAIREEILGLENRIDLLQSKLGGS